MSPLLPPRSYGAGITVRPDGSHLVDAVELDRLAAHHDAGADHVTLSVLTTPGGTDEVHVARRLASALGLGRVAR